MKHLSEAYPTPRGCRGKALPDPARGYADLQGKPDIPRIYPTCTPCISRSGPRAPVEKEQAGAAGPLFNKIIPMFNERLFIYPKDVMIITGKSLRTAQELIKRIKAHFGKTRNQHVTWSEFEQFMGIGRR